MTVLAIVLLAALAMAPVAWVLARGGPVRGRKEAAMALHRAQLAEIDRDREQGRLSAAEHATAALEIQRRLLAASDTAEEQAASGGRAVLIATLVVVPLLGAGLYLLNGRPDLPAAPLAGRVAAADRATRDQEQLIGELRRRLTELDPHSDTARQGYVLLGNVEAERGRFTDAAQAWRTALAIRFGADLAAQVAEAQTLADGHVSPESAALFRQALDAAPADAPWRELAEKRLAEAK